MSGPVERWIDQPGKRAGEERAAELLRQLPDPAPLDPVALARIRARIRRSSRQVREPLRWATALALLVGAAGAAAVALRLATEPPSAVDEITVAACSAARFTGDGQRRVALTGSGGGSGSMRLDRSGAGSLLLREGRLAVDSGDSALTVEALGARISIRPRRTGVIEVRDRRVRVAAWKGDLEVRWGDQLIEVPQGTTWGPDGVTPLAMDGAALGTRAGVDEIEALLDGREQAGACAPEATPPGVPPAAPAIAHETPAPPLPVPSLSPVIAAPRAPAEALALVPGVPVRDEGAGSPPAVAALATETAPPIAPPQSPLAAEHDLLATALQRLNRDRDPAGALAALDEHRARFPSGELTPSATLTRINALSALGRRSEALGILDRHAALGLGRAADLTLVRGELRAEAGRCREALADFATTLAGAPPPALEERALYGRGSCRARTGDDAGARSDLERYLARFPEGRFAAPARRALSE
ncbi:MAG: tetratricopeptide repeat protein [Myxococcales bacterium]|nr:tetratricopeptide repeat protein [Myxococcales bacterium]